MLFSKCHLKDILTLGISDIKTKEDIYGFLVPMMDELFTIFLNSSGISLGLYKELIALLVDCFSLSGVVVVSVNNTQDIDAYGIVKGVSYLFFSFLISKLFLERCLNTTTNTFSKIFIGAIFIYGIKLGIHLTVCMYKSYYSNKYLVNNSNKSNKSNKSNNSNNSTNIENNE